MSAAQRSIPKSTGVKKIIQNVPGNTPGPIQEYSRGAAEQTLRADEGCGCLLPNHRHWGFQQHRNKNIYGFLKAFLKRSRVQSCDR